jgi:hypothetical protein
LFWTVIAAATGALLVAVPLAVCLGVVWPALRLHRASRLGFVLATAPAVAIPVVFLVSIAVPVPPLTFGFLWALALVPALWPRVVVQVTGGPRPLDPNLEATISSAREAWSRYEQGDLHGAVDRIDRLDATRTPITSRYIDLWHRFFGHAGVLDEAAIRSRNETLDEIRRETVAIAARGPSPSRWSRWGAVLLVGVIGASPTLIEARACIGVEFLLPTEANDFTGPVPPFLDDPEPGARLVSDLAQTLDQEASTRFDPDSFQQLVDAGFQIAYHRVWLTPHGEQIEASEAIFEHADGALRFHQQVNRYACQFSNEAFAGPEGSVGLQVRHTTGPHPIVEQVSWVFGARRYVVSVGTMAPPPDHERVINLAQLAMEEPSP